MKISKYDYQDHTGQVRVELARIEGFPWYIFACDPEIDFSKYPAIQKLVDEICFLGTPNERRSDLLEEFYTQVRKLEGIAYKKNVKRKSLGPQFFRTSIVQT